MKIIIQQVNTQNEKNECMSIRRSVFIEEQNIPEMIELDDSVIKSTNFLAIYDGNFIGTARYRITNLGIKLERFAVLKDYRGVGA
ncbi:GNAT family N-acetyltransferase, partial [Candidatus Marinimicrobia bacterium]|nr:GNAT family N-acetyltransferase [Candidatus Neomarinimicrobiota bacterium]